MRALNSFRTFFFGYLIVIGFFAHVVVILGFVFALNYYQLTPSQFFIKAVEKSGVSAPWVVAALSPAPRYTEHTLDGRLRVEHPRRKSVV